VLRGAISHYVQAPESQPIEASADRRPLPDDYVYLECDALIDREQLWEYVARTLAGWMNNKRERPRARGRPARGVGWSITGYYPDAPQLSPAQVLIRKNREMGRVSQRKLAGALGISALTVWRIVIDSGIGWPLPE
jgi:hypothetical protein